MANLRRARTRRSKKGPLIRVLQIRKLLPKAVRRKQIKRKR
jgi:hypothetical protein